MNSVLWIFCLFTLAYASFDNLKVIVNEMINQKQRTIGNNLDGVTDVAGLISKINDNFSDGKIYIEIKNAAIKSLNNSVRHGTVSEKDAQSIKDTINKFKETEDSGRKGPPAVYLQGYP